KSLTRAARAICYATASEADAARHGETEPDRRAAADRAALLTPIAKAFSTDIGCEVASLGIQVHGGMGFIEETGAAQYYRDARILPIYEGTNGIQAIDLITRKLPLSGGHLVKKMISEYETLARRIKGVERLEIGRMGQRLASTVVALTEATDWMVEAIEHTPNLALAGATPYLRLFALTAGGHYLAKGAMQALEQGGPHAMESVGLARFFAENISVAGPGLAAMVMSGGQSVIGALPELTPA
ncbi:acyl-CoA dehydrogenase, partial [uncultured Hyphomicrobium sp.]